jgi:hypothetical protein
MLRPNDPIRLGQTIRTGRTSAIEINFDLDGRLLVWPGARMVLRKPGPASDRHADCQSEVVARIELRRGDIQVDHDSDARVAALKPRVLEIETGDARICLYGTSIQVHVDPEFGTGVFVRETGAWVRPLQGGDWVKLDANQQTLVKGSRKPRVVSSQRLILMSLEGESRVIDSPLFDPIVF